MNSQFIIIPHELGGKRKLTNLDRFVYMLLRKYMDGKTMETFVSQSTLASKAHTSQPTINKSLERLCLSGEIEIKSNGKGRSNNYKIKKDTRDFEMISFDFINMDNISPELKGFYAAYQGFCFKDQDGYARCTYTIEELSKKMNIDRNTIRKYFKQLEELEIMSIGLTRQQDPTTGLMRDVKMINLEMVCQATLYINTRVDKLEEKVEQENTSMKKHIKTLENRIKELEKDKYTKQVSFEEIKL